MRSVVTYRGTVENGDAILPEEEDTPEKTHVKVVLPDLDPQRTYRGMSPRLAHPEQAKDLVKEAIEETPNAR